MRRNNFTYLIKQGIVSVWKNRLMSFASICILMVSLLLVGLSVLLMMDVEIILGNVEDKNEIAVFLNDDADETHIKDMLTTNEFIESVVFVSKEEGLAKYMEGQDEYTALFESLPFNPVPAAFKVQINDLSKMDSVVEQIKTIDGVYEVSAPYDFAGFMVDIRGTLTIIGIAVLIALVTVCIVIVSNATRASVFARRKEISIMKYVGATNSFIKTPFFVEGAFIGIIAGAASWILTQLAYNALYQLFSQDISLWVVFGMINIIPFESVSLYCLAFNCIAGALLSTIGTMLSMGKHLKV